MKKLSINLKDQDQLVDFPLVNVVIPIFNRGKFLHRSIDSVIKQTYEKWKLILVDDGSTDNSVEVCQKYCDLFPDRVTVVQQGNTGVGGARNLGISHSDGKYIALLDSDDAWRPNFLEVMVDAIESYPAVDLVYCSYRRLIDEEEILVESSFEHSSAIEFRQLKVEHHKKLNLITDPNFLLTAIRSSIKCSANSIIKQKIFNDTLYNTNMNVGEDRLLNIELISKGVKFGYVKEVLLDVYSHNENISGANKGGTDFSKDQKIFYDLIQVYEYVKEKVQLNATQNKGLKERLSKLYVHFGCSVVENNSSIMPGIKFLRMGFSLDPVNLDFWKSILSCFFYRYKKKIGL